MKNRICKVCSEIYTGRSDSFFCCLACKSKWHRAKKAEIMHSDLVYLAQKVQSSSKSGNLIAEKYLGNNPFKKWD